MKLRFKPASPEVKAAFSQGLAQASASYLRAPYSPQHDYHLAGYSLSLKHLAAIPAGAGIDNVVRTVGWQCFGTCDKDPGNLAVVAEVTPLLKAPRQSGESVTRMRMTSLFYGVEVNEGYKKARELHSRADGPGFPKGDYEPRVLRIPGLLITAFWMQSMNKAAQEDVIVPIHWVPTVKLNEWYTLSAFLKHIQQLATKRLSNPVME
jgi:hypothetical protein